MAESRWEFHEVALGTLGVGTWIALSVRAGLFAGVTLQVAVATLLFAGILGALKRVKGGWARKAGLAAAYPFTLWFYGAVRQITPALRLPLRDGLLMAVDRALVGQTPAVALGTLAAPALTDALSVCYLSYQLYLHAALLQGIWAPLYQTQRLFRPLFTLFAVGFGLYLCVPAVGPEAAFPHLFSGPLVGGPWSALNAWVVARGGAVYDAFPSLHVALTGALLAHDARYLRWRFALALPVAAGMVFATLYLRYHYAIDLLAGGALAAAAGAVFWRQPRREPSAPTEAAAFTHTARPA